MDASLFFAAIVALLAAIAAPVIVQKRETPIHLVFIVRRFVPAALLGVAVALFMAALGW